MADIKITNLQKVPAILNPTDINGMKAPVYNQKWSIEKNEDGSVGDCTLEPAEDGNSCQVVSNTDATISTVQCISTKTSDPESEKLVDRGIVSVGVEVGPATTLGMNFGIPTNK